MPGMHSKQNKPGSEFYNPGFMMDVVNKGEVFDGVWSHPALLTLVRFVDFRPPFSPVLRLMCGRTGRLRCTRL